MPNGHRYHVDDFLGALARGEKKAVCNLMQYGASGLQATGWASIFADLPSAGAVQLGVAEGLQFLAGIAGCDFDPNGPRPPGGEEGSGDGKCWKIKDGSTPGVLTLLGDDGQETIAGTCVEIESWTWAINQGVVNKGQIIISMRTDHGEPFTVQSPGIGAGTVVAAYITLLGGSRCDAQGPDYGQPDPIIYKYIDETTNCSFVYELQGFVQSSNGAARPVFKVEADPTERDACSGGRIGGCCFAPTLYVGGDGNGPPDHGPWPPLPPVDPEDPWWKKLLESMAYGATAGLTEEALEQLISALTPAEAAVKYNLTAVCPTDVDPEGNLWQCNYDIDSAKGTRAVVQRLDALALMMQCDLGRQKLTCGGGAPKIDGKSVKINFESVEPSSMGKSRLRKLFGYRSRGDRSLESLFGYWESFEWEAGPVIVKHHDAWWGQLQVWAISEEEGKRVIRFAGVDAGINPDEEGTWKVQIATGSRNGRTGRMRVSVGHGQWGVCARDGASAPTYWPLLLNV